MDNICNSKFWDSNLTWYTSNPDFTECFQHTVLVWIPCGFLWLFVFLEVQSYFNSNRRNIPWSVLNTTKQVIVTALVFLDVINLGSHIYQETFYCTETLSSTIKCATYILVLLLLIHGPKYAIKTSGVQFIFWFMATVSELIIFRSIVIFFHDKYKENPVAVCVSLMECPLVTFMLLLSFVSDKRQKYELPEGEKETMKHSPEEEFSFISQLIYSWLDRLIWKGYKKPLEMADIYNLKYNLRALPSSIKFERVETSQTNNIKNRNIIQKSETDMNIPSVETKFLPIPTENEKKHLNIIFLVIRAFGPSYILPTIIHLLSDVLTFTNPVLIGWLIEFASSDEPSWKGYFYAFLVFFLDLLKNLCIEYRFKKTLDIGYRINGSILSSVYRKSLRLSNSAQKEISVGSIVNCVTVDTMRFHFFVWKMHNLWAAPLIIILASAYLYKILGVSAFAGIFLIALLMPASVIISRWRKVLQEKLMTCKDKRIKMINEVLNGIRVLKLYAWEKSFQKEIQNLRMKEAVILKKLAWLNGLTSAIWQFAPILVTLTSFAMYVLWSELPLTASVAFVSLRLFAILNLPLSMIPDLLSETLLTYVSICRVNKILNAEELKCYVSPKSPNQPSNNAIALSNCSFSWSTDSKTVPVLRNISLEVQRGALVAIVGQVGSGKSSLMSAILGDMNKIEGDVSIHGSLAYLPQQAWIQNATFKNNILFYEPFDKNKYEKVIEACALDEDIDALPSFDDTEIGEKGINLSGGQKQRVSLARAVYMDKDIYLLDDPLGAVDSHTGKHIFNKVLGPDGLLKNKTRILITHNISLLPSVNEIYVITDGELNKLGKYEDILNSEGNFKQYLLNYASDIVDDNELKTKLDFEDVSKSLKKTPKWKSKSQREDTDSAKTKHPNDKKRGEKIIMKEKVEHGETPLTVHLQYIKAIGISWNITILVSLIGSCFFLMYSNYWLVLWSDEAENHLSNNSTLTTRRMLTVYGVLNGFSVASVFTTAISLALGALAATIKMHSKMLLSILRSPLHFFDTTPVGRILNRFSADIQQTDQLLPTVLNGFMNSLFQLIAFTIATTLMLPSFFVGVASMLVLFVAFERFYIRAGRQLRRLCPAALSPVVTHFSDSVTGSSIIRAMEVTDRFTSQAQSIIDRNHSVHYLYMLTFRWVAVRLSFIVSLLLFAASICSVLAKGSISPGTTGFVLTNANSMVLNVSMLIFGLSQVEAGAISVERIVEYFTLESEDDWEQLETKPKPNWPSLGKIVFWNYCTRYRKELDLVLQNVSFVINPKEKVGVVGRTGAGKSSLALALFRMIEPVSGEIIIDDVNISTIGLHDLRSKLTIIPQDPVLFSGTLRFNLDPFEQFKDKDIWNALENSHLKAFAKSLELGLDHVIEEGGKNISVGQRQMVCLARALLRKSKILVLDEATASIDQETDDLIQITIKEEFKFCTVLTIAHRLNTVMDYDRILVINEGQVMEYDTPSSLLQNTFSIFHGLAKDAGLV